MNVLSLRPMILLAATLAWSAPARPAEPNWPDHLTLGTASPGGTYYVYGDALAKILTQALGLPVLMQPTEGPVQNIELMEAGDIQLGFVTVGVALHAWNASGVWAGRKPARAMRAIFPMYDTPFQVMALQESGIRSIADIAGKRVGVGPQGGTAATYASDFFKVLNLPVILDYGEWTDLAAQMHAKAVDVLFVGAGVPFPSFIELEAKDKVRYVPLAPEHIVALRLALPELTPSRIFAGTYPSLLRHYQTVGLYNFAVARADLASDLVYQIVKAVFDNNEELMEAHAAAAATVPANIDRNSFLPLHPGAIRYYQQIGKEGHSD